MISTLHAVPLPGWSACEHVGVAIVADTDITDGRRKRCALPRRCGTNQALPRWSWDKRNRAGARPARTPRGRVKRKQHLWRKEYGNRRCDLLHRLFDGPDKARGSARRARLRL